MHIEKSSHSFLSTWGVVILEKKKGVLISATSCPMFAAFLEQQIQLSVDRSLPTTAYHRKPLKSNKLVKDFASSWICFIKGPCLMFGLYPVSISWLQLKIDTGKSYFL